MATGDLVLTNLTMETILGLDAQSQSFQAPWSPLVRPAGASGPESQLEAYNFTKQDEYRYLKFLGIAPEQPTIADLVVSFQFYQTVALANDFYFGAAISPIVPGAAGTDVTAAYTLNWVNLAITAINQINRPNPFAITIPFASHGLVKGQKAELWIRRRGLDAEDTALGGARVTPNSLLVTRP